MDENDRFIIAIGTLEKGLKFYGPWDAYAIDDAVDSLIETGEEDINVFKLNSL